METLTENEKHTIAIDLVIDFMSPQVREKIMQKGYSLQIVALDYLIRQKQSAERLKNKIFRVMPPRGLNLYKSISQTDFKILDIHF